MTSLHQPLREEPEIHVEILEPPRYAPEWLRFIARLLDVAILLGIYLIIQELPARLLGLDPFALKFRSDPIFHWGDLLLILGYEILFTTYWGATPGKLLAGMRVLEVGDQPARLRGVLIRMGVLWICPLSAVLLGEPLLLAPIVLDLCFPIVSAESQTWHDVVARTVVKRVADLPEGTSALERYAMRGPRVRLLAIWLGVLILGTGLQQAIVNSIWQREENAAARDAALRSYEGSVTLRVPRGWEEDPCPDLSTDRVAPVARLGRGGLHFDLVKLPANSSPREAATKYAEILSEDLLQKSVQGGVREAQENPRQPTSAWWTKPAPGVALRLLQHRFLWENDYYVRVEAMPKANALYLLRVWGSAEDFASQGPGAQVIISSFEAK